MDIGAVGERLGEPPRQNILRLEVPVDDVVLVQVLQGTGNLQDDQLDTLGRDLVARALVVLQLLVQGTCSEEKKLNYYYKRSALNTGI